jgi:catechol 2,3-dioxygenase-like lactoylglutathione lyase family enzyme
MLDHVAIHVADRDATADELVAQFDWHVIERTERFTLLGADAAHGKLTLLDAEDDRAPQPNRILSIVLAESGNGTPPPVELRDGLVVTFVATDELGAEWAELPRHALVGVSLRATDPPIAAAEFESYHGMHVGSMTSEFAVLRVGEDSTDGRITLSRERWSDDTAPSMLDHIGIRIDDAEAWRAKAEAAQVDVVKWVEAPHSKAVFVAGPDGLLIEYVELTAPLEG